MPPRAFTSSVSFTSTIDPREATGWFAELIEREPVAMSVIASVTAQSVDEPERYDDARWWAGRAEGTVVAGFMRTPPHPLHVGVATAEQARALARALAAEKYAVGGIGGLRTAAEAFRDEWTQLTGALATTTMELGVFALPRPPVVPFEVAGHYRLAGTEELGLVDGWMVDFHAETIPEGPSPRSLAPHLARGRIGLWVVDGTTVSMAFAARAAGGVTRISGVWTPPEQRRRGYASAVVAALSANRMAHGERCMLYTDLANSTSNAIYQALGYRRIGDSITVRLA